MTDDVKDRVNVGTCKCGTDIWANVDERPDVNCPKCAQELIVEYSEGKGYWVRVKLT